MNVTDVQGIPAFWVERPDDESSVRAGLVFRVGEGDEELHRRGTTRLLASRVQGIPGRTTLMHTVFDAEGHPSQVAARLGAIAEVLAGDDDVDAARSATSLAAERPPSARSLFGRVGNEIFGCRGAGLLALPELGLERPDPVWLGSWRRTYFTRGNVAVWSVGRPPQDLDLGALAPGERSAAPGLTRHWTGGRRRVTHPIGGVALATVVPRSTILPTVMATLERRLRSRLDGGPATRDGAVATRDGAVATRVDADPVDALDALVTVFVACPPDRSEAVLERLLLELMTLRLRGLDEPMAEPPPRRPVEDVVSAAADTLLGRPVLQPEERARRAGQATVRDVVDLATALCDDAILVVPHGVGGDRRFRTAADPNAWTIPDAHADFPSADPGQPDASLLVGRSGITVARGERRSSFRFRDIDAMARFEDDGRILWHADGRTFVLDPDAWRGAANLPFEIDERIDRDRQITFGRPLAGPLPAPEAVA